MLFILNNQVLQVPQEGLKQNKTKTPHAIKEFIYYQDRELPANKHFYFKDDPRDDL